jgi:hypothetical protein
MKRIILVGALASAISGGGWALAQNAAKPAAPPAAPAVHEHGPGKPAGDGMMCGHMMGGGMGAGMMGGGMGAGMMGGSMGAGMGALMGGPGTKVAVKAIDKGVTITLTAPDPAAATRLQKMAEAMRLMHEAMNP